MKNGSDINNADVGPSLNRLSRGAAIAYVLVFAAELLVIVIGNGVVITVFLRTWRIRRRKSYWPAISLAFADLLVGAVNGPLWAYDLASRGSGLLEHHWDESVFVAVESVFLYLFYASLINLTIIALERMHATLRPTKHRHLGPEHYHRMIALAWVMSFIFPSLNVVMRRRQISSHTFSSVWIASNCFLLMVVFASYGSIAVKFKFYRHPHVTAGQERRLTKSLFLVTVVSMVTWLPSVALTVPTASEALIKISSDYVFNHVLNCLGLLIFANSMVNPIIYSFKMPVFRQATLRLFRHRSKAGNQARATEMRNLTEGTRSEP